MHEEWKPIPEYPDYEASSLGRIRRSTDGKWRTWAGRILKPRTGHKYLRVGLYKQDQYVHRLVAMTFHGIPDEALKLEVAHLDGDRLNNHASNLKWATRSENHRHKRLHGTATVADRHPNTKITIEKSKRLIVLYLSGVPVTELAKRFKVYRSYIGTILSGKERPELTMALRREIEAERKRRRIENLRRNREKIAERRHQMRMAS